LLSAAGLLKKVAAKGKEEMITRRERKGQEKRNREAEKK